MHLEVPLEGLENLSTRVEPTEPLVLDLRLESLTGAIVASGRVKGRWSAVCSRCLNPVETEFDLRLREVFEEDPVEEETYPLLHHAEIDLEQPLRDAVLPELPIVPLCRPDCAGLCATCGGNLNEGDCDCDAVPADARWEALRDLEL